VQRSLVRSERLLAISAELGKALTPLQVARVLADHGAAVLGARAVMVGMIRPDGQTLEILAASGYSNELVDRFASVSIDVRLPITDAIRGREPVVLSTIEARREAYPELEDVRDLIGLKAMAMLPLMVDGRAVGGLGFHFDRELSMGEEERALMSALASQCAQALERTRLYEQEQRARREAEDAQKQTAQLYQLTAAVNRATTLEEVYDPALDAVRGALGVDRASVLLFDADGVIRFKAWRGLSEAYRQAVEGHSPWREDSLYAASLFVADVEQEPALEQYLPVFRAEQIRGVGFVPLMHQKLLGKFMIYSREPRYFSAHEVRLAEAIAAHVAQAVSRQRANADVQRLYLDAEAARHRAEAAAHARENLLAVVSHDLRNPLSSIMVSASRLGDKKEVDRRHADTIQRSALRMQRLIQDLLDLAAIDVNALPIEPEPVSAQLVLSQAIELLQPLAAEKNQQLELIDCAAELSVLADQDRILQVLSNVMGNAIKFAPVGGHVRVSVEERDEYAEFVVFDNGPGIMADDLPHIFERYWKSTPQALGGIGLGLSIAKGIIQAHGGLIWADADVESGAVIRFTLPRV
jgi:signal transduction histidine kinase